VQQPKPSLRAPRSRRRPAEAYADQGALGEAQEDAAYSPVPFRAAAQKEKNKQHKILEK